MARDERRPMDPTRTWARLASRPAPAERTPLTRDEIVTTAIRLIDDEGLDAFSMRRLGAELGAGATSLYWHVRNKDELVDLILDEIIGEVVADFDAHADAGNDWQEQLAEVARSLRRVMLRHRHIAPLIGERPTLGPQALDASERVMGILVDAGFDGLMTSLATGALITYAFGFAMAEARLPGGSSQAPESLDAAAAVAAYFAGLPEERYPHTRAIAAIPVTEEQQFEYGLERLIAGIAADLSPAVRDGDPHGEPADDDGQSGNVIFRH